ncbi:hypothetical protein [Chenggangzhangella methanolivorans]|uniref:Uncharacterized protein n=1 Tax=Chenggangzhangella methanolivorans TaxID=1437009 RepID=A0A9E6ULF7_9HYPH|nr:hypothetical protein [Chenggangzhangella methanolivorans]QZO00497.1 hypothetical protein K6K41_01760 [Chenggangzhangella methanolivorans]
MPPSETDIGFDPLAVGAGSPPRSAAATRLAQAGQAIFGPRFHAPLATELKVSRPLLFAMVNDQRRITPDVERRLAVTIRARIVPQLEARIETLALLAESIERKLEAYSQTPAVQAEPRP